MEAAYRVPSLRSKMSEIEMPAVRAPDFPAGLDWIDTDGRAFAVADLRGKIAILDFWTYG
jgi:hypothetical protein